MDNVDEKRPNERIKSQSFSAVAPKGASGGGEDRTQYRNVLSEVPKEESSKVSGSPSAESHHRQEVSSCSGASDEEQGAIKDKKRTRGIAGKTFSGLMRGILYILFVSVTGICIAVFAIIPIGNDMFAFVVDEEIVDITIPELATLNDVAEILYENGLIEYPEIFKLYANFQGDDGEFVAGDYSLSTTLNYGQLLDSFKSTETTEIVSITIPEGYTTDEIIAL